MNLLELCVQEINDDSLALVYAWDDWKKEECFGVSKYDRHLHIEAVPIVKHFDYLDLPKEDFWLFVKDRIESQNMTYPYNDDNLNNLTSIMVINHNRVAITSRRGCGNKIVANPMYKNLVEHYIDRMDFNRKSIQCVGYTDEIEGIITFYNKKFEDQNAFDGGMFYKELDNGLIRLYYGHTKTQFGDGLNYFKYIDPNNQQPSRWWKRG